MPIISIITVCKNPGKEIEKTINSVISQKFKDVQYIVIDGGSADGTQEYLKKLKKKKIISKLVIEKDKGVYDAINKGIKLANGKFIGIIHAGDTYKKNIFFKLLKNFNSKTDIIYGLCELDFIYFSKIIKLNKNSYKNLKKKMSIMHPSTFVNKAVYDKIGLYNKNFKISGDFDFFYRSINKNYKFLFVNKVLTKIVYGGISTKLNNLFLIVKENSDIIYNKNNFICKFFSYFSEITFGFFYFFKINTQIFIKLLFKKRK
jgi:glycosyltransferase involved in cell wall biosynthesis